MGDQELDEDNRAGGRQERSYERAGDRRILPIQPVSHGKPVAEVVSFDRHELREILNLYGRRVAEGEWRDYAIDFTAQEAVFSIYRRACEYPLYRILKTPRLARKQGAFSVVTASGLVLKRGHELKNVIRVLDKKLTLVSG